ncbi:MAG: hypothetical protein ACK458_04035 [Sphingobacteriales bacterium]
MSSFEGHHMNAKPHIARTYRNMTDEQILQFVDNEGVKLTPEALTLLYQEFVRRKLDTQKIAALRSLRTQNYVLEYTMADLARRVWWLDAFIYKRKNGATDEEIMLELEEMGVSDEEIKIFMDQMSVREIQLEEVADKAGLKILGRIIVLIIMGVVMFAGGAKYSGNIGALIVIPFAAFIVSLIYMKRE